MYFAPISSPSRRLAGSAAALLLVAACAVPTGQPTPSPTPAPTVAPTAPPYELGPEPSACPTAVPAPLPAGATNTVTMVTNFGLITIKVDGALGPNAAGAFTALARCGYYNNVLVHRIIPKFVIQAGDGQYARLPSFTPEKMGQGGPLWTVADDPVTKPYVRGMVAIARTAAANSGSSQFFVVLDDEAQSALGAETANNYAQIGYVTSGMDVVDRIALIPTGGESNPQDFPLQPAVILRTTVSVP
jgi:cyclophilin family peptidyl-prolyl cis-trans isomerase